MKFLVGVLFAMAVGCGGGKACEELKQKACEGLDAAACGKWFDDYILEGPVKGEKLTAAEANEGCKMVLADDTVTKAYKEKAKSVMEKAKK